MSSFFAQCWLLGQLEPFSSLYAQIGVVCYLMKMSVIMVYKEVIVEDKDMQC